MTFTMRYTDPVSGQAKFIVFDATDQGDAFTKAASIRSELGLQSWNAVTLLGADPQWNLLSPALRKTYTDNAWTFPGAAGSSTTVTDFPITAGGPLPEEQEPSAAFIRAMRERGLSPLRQDKYSQALWNQYQPALGTFMGQEALRTLGPQGTVSQGFDPQAFQNYLGGMTPQSLRSGAMGAFQNLLNTTVEGGQWSPETREMTQPTTDAAFGQSAALARQARAAQTGISPLAMRFLMPGADRAVQEFMAGGSATDVGTFYPWLKQYYGVGA